MLNAVLDPGRQLDLGLVADYDYWLRERANAAASMLSRANVLDGIFVAQLGLHVNVAELVVLDQSTDPLTDPNPSALLEQLEAYRFGTPRQRAQDLTHLLTGKDLNDPSTSTQIVGIANLAAVCDERLGTALTQASFGTTGDALVMAHEIGHNFGAPHDGEAGPCRFEPLSYIMASAFTGGRREFSACSIQQMQPELASSCLDLIATGDVEIRTLNAPSDAEIGRDFELDVVVDNPSTLAAYGLEVTAVGSDLTVLGLTTVAAEGFTCTSAASGPRCRGNMLAAGGSATFRLVARATAIATTTLQVSVHTLNDDNTANNVVSNSFAARPVLDLLVEFAAASDLLRLGEEVEYTATVRNAGNVTAIDAEAVVLVSEYALAVVEMSSAVGPCTLDRFWYYCPLGALPPNAVRSLSMRLRAVAAFLPQHASQNHVNGTIQVEAVADRPVYDRVRSSKRKHITVAQGVSDLRTTVSSPLQLELNALSELVFTIENLGPDRADEVSFDFNPVRFHQELVDAVVVSNIGTCAISERSPLKFGCQAPSLPVGQSLVVTLRATAVEAAQFRILGQAAGRLFDPVVANNDVDVSYSVAAPPTPSTPTQPPAPVSNPFGTTNSGGAGGGGGFVDALWLALLLAALAMRRYTSTQTTRAPAARLSLRQVAAVCFSLRRRSVTEVASIEAKRQEGLQPLSAHRQTILEPRHIAPLLHG